MDSFEGPSKQSMKCFHTDEIPRKFSSVSDCRKECVTNPLCSHFTVSKTGEQFSCLMCHDTLHKIQISNDDNVAMYIKNAPSWDAPDGYQAPILGRTFQNIPENSFTIETVMKNVLINAKWKQTSYLMPRHLK